MKALALVPHSMHVEQTWKSLSCIGCEVIPYRYDLPGHHANLISLTETMHPDFIVYFGGVENGPSPELFCQLRDLAPTILIAGDASDPPWYPLLNEYHAKDSFAVMVNVDGNFDTPIADFGLVLLMPQDPDQCGTLVPWDERTRYCTFVGNTTVQDTPRSHILQEMQARGAINLFGPFSSLPFETMMLIMTGSKVTFNTSSMGPRGETFNVKGRVVEAAAAGCCLLEQRNSHTAYWFEAGRDYLDYDSVGEACNILAANIFSAEMAERFRAKWLAEHHPKVFWDTVLTRAGVR